jgi:mRNA interferase HigB
MRLIKRSTLVQYWRKYPEAERPLKQWLDVAKASRWNNIQAVRMTYPHADAAVVASGNTVTIFNTGGNDFRLIVSIKYKWGIIYIREFLTHPQYSKNAWKKRH